MQSFNLILKIATWNFQLQLFDEADALKYGHGYWLLSDMKEWVKLIEWYHIAKLT